jgi:5'-nucleotidase
LGLRALVEVLLPYGELAVIAPERAMSGKSSAITVETPLRLKETEIAGLPVYQCSGTPVDCVKVGVNHLLKRRPDFVVSGINHGSNSSVNVLYSGTMGAAVEGALNGVPSIGFSLCSHAPDADFSCATGWVARIFRAVASNGMPSGVCLNVNIPEGDISDFEICRQTTGRWVEEIISRHDPAGKEYLWLAGEYRNLEPEVAGTDINALDNNRVAIVPIQVDMTAHKMLAQLKNWDI